MSLTDMSPISNSLAKALPKPKYTGENEELPSHIQSKGPRILGAGALDETQLVLKVNSHKTEAADSLPLLT